VSPVRALLFVGLLAWPFSVVAGQVNNAPSRPAPTHPYVVPSYAIGSAPPPTNYGGPGNHAIVPGAANQTHTQGQSGASGAHATISAVPTPTFSPSFNGSVNSSVQSSSAAMPVGQIPASTSGRLQLTPVVPASSTAQPGQSSQSSYTFLPTNQNTVQVFQNGRLISTTTQSNAALNYGYQPAAVAISSSPSSLSSKGSVGDVRNSQPSNVPSVPLSPYNPNAAYKAQMASKVASVIPANGQTAGLGGTPTVLTRYQNNNQAPYGLGYCTDYAQKVYNDVTGKSVTFPGNAANWYAEAASLNLQTLPASAINRVPPGAIAVWSGISSETAAGHVAVVTSNNGNTIGLSETNWGAYNASSSAYDKRYEVTPNFNTVSNKALSYQDMQTHADPGTNEPNGYQLQGFILP
jgi:surface antigen